MGGAKMSLSRAYKTKYIYFLYYIDYDIKTHVFFSPVLYFSIAVMYWPVEYFMKISELMTILY